VLVQLKELVEDKVIMVLVGGLVVMVGLFEFCGCHVKFKTPVPLAVSVTLCRSQMVLVELFIEKNFSCRFYSLKKIYPEYNTIGMSIPLLS
jgi:hypothetical protein